MKTANRLPQTSENGQEPKTDKKAEAIATIAKDRTERLQRASSAIKGVCDAERVTLAVTSFNLNQGRIEPLITLVALE